MGLANGDYRSQRHHSTSSRRTSPAIRPRSTQYRQRPLRGSDVRERYRYQHAVARWGVGFVDRIHDGWLDVFSSGTCIPRSSNSEARWIQQRRSCIAVFARPVRDVTERLGRRSRRRARVRGARFGTSKRRDVDIDGTTFRQAEPVRLDVRAAAAWTLLKLVGTMSNRSASVRGSARHRRVTLVREVRGGGSTTLMNDRRSRRPRRHCAHRSCRGYAGRWRRGGVAKLPGAADRDAGRGQGSAAKNGPGVSSRSLSCSQPHWVRRRRPLMPRASPPFGSSFTAGRLHRHASGLLGSMQRIRSSRTCAGWRSTMPTSTREQSIR